MATIELTKTDLVVRIRGWNVIHAMHRTLRVPLGQVRAVRVRPAEADFDHAIVEGWRGIGTYVPRKRAAGLLHLRNGPSFLEVRDPKHTIAVDVQRVSVWGYHVNHVIVQIDGESPEAAATRIDDAMARFIGWASAKFTPHVASPPRERVGVAAELIPSGVSAALGRW
jgi:hypothetical protein